MHRRTIARLTLVTPACSLPGLWLCNLAERNEAFSHSIFHTLLETLFIVGSCVGLLLLAYMILAWKKPTREEIVQRINPVEMSVVQQATFYATYGNLPRWLYLPFLIIGVLLTALASLGIIGMAIWMIVS